MAKIDTNENYKDEKEIYFMLKIDENGGYVSPVTRDGKVIDSFCYYDIKDPYIKKAVSFLTEVNEDVFFIDWEKTIQNVYLDDFYEFEECLKHIENFVTEDFQKIVWSLTENEITLKIEDVENEPDMVKPVVPVSYTHLTLPTT